MIVSPRDQVLKLLQEGIRIRCIKDVHRPVSMDTVEWNRQRWSTETGSEDGIGGAGLNPRRPDICMHQPVRSILRCVWLACYIDTYVTYACRSCPSVLKGPANSKHIYYNKRCSGNMMQGVHISANGQLNAEHVRMEGIARLKLLTRDQGQWSGLGKKGVLRWPNDVA